MSCFSSQHIQDDFDIVIYYEHAVIEKQNGYERKTTLKLSIATVNLSL